jgi:hypothetical protein
MKIDFNFIMAIVNAVQHVEATIHESGTTKKQKAVEIVKAGLGAASAADPKVEQVIGQTIDTVVAVANTLKAA